MRIIPLRCLAAATWMVVAAVAGVFLFCLPPVRASPEPTAGVRIIELDEFRKILADHNGVVIDARPETFYRVGHVPGAVNIPRYKVIVSQDEVRGKLPKDQLLTIYCDSKECQDASLEAQALTRMGYTRIVIFGGGIKEWRKQGLPEERAAATAQDAAGEDGKSR